MKELSRQRLWQIEKERQGLCIICGGKLQSYKQLCDYHAVKVRIRMRNYNNLNPYPERRWRGGKRPFIVGHDEVLMKSMERVR